MRVHGRPEATTGTATYGYTLLYGLLLAKQLPAGFYGLRCIQYVKSVPVLCFYATFTLILDLLCISWTHWFLFWFHFTENIFLLVVIIFTTHIGKYKSNVFLSFQSLFF